MHGRLLLGLRGLWRCNGQDPSPCTSRKMAIYDYIYDCVFSHLGQVFAYMTGAHRSYCGPVITDTQSYGTLK
jgi:hypothetical protein